MDEGRVFGYARVSTKEQNLARQIDALLAYPVSEDRIVADKASGKDFDRQGYQRLLEELSPGDTLVVKSLDRLGRSFNETLDQWHRLTREMEVHVVVLDDPAVSTQDQVQELEAHFIAQLLLLIRSYSAQVERDNIRQRQAEGIRSARLRGVQFGRPALPLPDNFPEVASQFANGNLRRREAAALLGVSTGTFDAWRKHAALEEGISRQSGESV